MRKHLAVVVFGVLLGACGLSSQTSADGVNPANEVEALALVADDEPTSVASRSVGSASDQSAEFQAVDLTVADALASLELLSGGGLEIEHRVSGEVEDASYETVEIVTVNADRSVIGVALDATELGDYYDDLVPRALAAQEESGAQSQGFGVTFLLVQSLAQDQGEYFIADDMRVTRARSVPWVSEALDSLWTEVELDPSGEVALEELMAGLDGLWVGSEIRQNEQPHALGYGHLLPEVVPELLDRIGFDENFAFSEQTHSEQGSILTGETSAGGQVSVAFDGQGQVRSIAFEAVSPLLGAVESHTVEIRELSPNTSIVLPSEDVLVTEEEVLQRFLVFLADHLPELRAGVDAAQRATEGLAGTEFTQIDNRLGGVSE